MLIHLANTNYENELASLGGAPSLIQSLNRSSIASLLQFLPLLYAKSDEFVGVSALPSKESLLLLQESEWIKAPLPECCLIDRTLPSPIKRCYPWGHSRSMAEWARKQALLYSFPADFESIRKINSKAFSFEYSRLEGASLVRNRQELLDWVKKNPGEKVLKSCFGLSGSGNRRFISLEEEPSLLRFCEKEWTQGLPLVAEPWVKRELDFSTQWLIEESGEVELIGATRFNTNEKGVYKGTIAGPEKELFASYEGYLEEHKREARQLLKRVQERGYFGHVGIDAFLYRKKEQEALFLNPILEINARQTMSLVALRVQQKISPHRVIHLFFERGEGESLLPRELTLLNGKKLFFPHRLFFKWKS